MRKLNNKKGITLVEVIVVLIIMAVLAGILVASYTGYIDTANDDKALVEARAVYLAASTYYNEAYAGVYAPTTADVKVDSVAKLSEEDICTLAGVDHTKVTVGEITTENGKIKTMTYVATNGKTCTLSATGWTVS